MTFKEYIEKAIEEEFDFDSIIGDVDMPATFCSYDEMKITDYCMEKYGDLLNSEVKELYSTSDYYKTIEVFYNNDKVGRDFIYAAAGYIDDYEYKKLFDC